MKVSSSILANHSAVSSSFSATHSHERHTFSQMWRHGSLSEQIRSPLRRTIVVTLMTFSGSVPRASGSTMKRITSQRCPHVSMISFTRRSNLGRHTPGTRQ